MQPLQHWRKEPGPRLAGSRDLDLSKLQAPCITAIPGGGYRLFYTAVGPAKPFVDCQGYLLSAISDDGVVFRTEPGIRLAPRPELPHMSLRLIAATVTAAGDGGWRMYFEARGTADRPTVICSASSRDMFHWKHEPGIRLHAKGNLGGPRYVPLPEGGGRLYCFRAVTDGAGERRSQHVVSAGSTNGLNFCLDSGVRLADRSSDLDSIGITAAEVIPPPSAGAPWTMVYSAWQEPPADSEVPLHPSQDIDAIASGSSADFAAASIAADIAGYRSRIFTATSPDGLSWTRSGCALEGSGYGSDELDAVHAEDMTLIEIQPGIYRMYYAACDRHGRWSIASAVSAEGE
ncbi:MAG: hypothetical protein CMJ59_08215 [Planctomycetaceae bacterium]|nr:hypothetical protein [Planctomycetaceae bacterium]